MGDTRACLHFDTFHKAGMEIEFGDDHVHIRPWHNGDCYGVVGFWNVSTLRRFCDVLEHGGLFVDRFVSKEDFSATECRCLVDRERGIIAWQGSNGDYWQQGSGPYITYFMIIHINIVIQKLRDWAGTHTLDDEDTGVVWLL